MENNEEIIDNPFEEIDNKIVEEDKKIFKPFKVKDFVFLAIMASCMLITGGIMPLALGIPLFGAIELCLGLQFSIFPAIALMKTKKLGSLTLISIFLGAVLAFMFFPMFICLVLCGFISEALTLIIFRGYKKDSACVFAATIYTPLTIPFLFLWLKFMYSKENPKSAIQAMISPELWQVFVISVAVLALCFIGAFLGYMIAKELRKAGKFN